MGTGGAIKAERRRDMDTHDRPAAAVVGLGYVGLPMAVALAKAGYRVYGLDVDEEKINRLNAGKSTVIGIDDETIRSVQGEFTAGGDYAAVSRAQTIVICVPTPLTAEREPDLTFIRSAVAAMLPHLKRGTLVVLESTTYPGTTDELIRRVVEEARGWRVGEDFHLCYSPERIDPGNRVYRLDNSPKIVGGATPACLEAGVKFYRSIVQQVVPVSSTAAAEAAKLFENTFRNVNIALVNEFALLCERLGISVWEVVRAAATKPFGFLPFWPGPGIGGHCIPVDPIYLNWTAKRYGRPMKLIELADEVNRRMPQHVVERVTELLNREGKPMRGARIALIGIAYKPDVDDVRESPALDILDELAARQADVVCCDPLVPSFRHRGRTFRTVSLTPELLAGLDLAVILTRHASVDVRLIAEHAPLVLDTRNALDGFESGHIARLGEPSLGLPAAQG
jgi:UDP-N-acetyl-D-glucosamine dehydrogenase